MSRSRPLTGIKQLIIHCAATPNGHWFTAGDIDLWHQQRGFHRSPALAQASPYQSIGYHFVITLDGGVQVGRRLDETGAHAKGHNRHSVGLCLIGTDQFTLAQWQSLKQQVSALQNRFSDLAIFGHRAVNAHKSCPGFGVGRWLTGEMQPLADHVLSQ